MPRGLKINNPGNIRTSADVYKGEVISSDLSFTAFSSLDYGFRAMAVIIYNYFVKYNLNSIRKIITRYAPPSDGNNTESYIATIAGRVGVSPDRIITKTDFLLPSPLMRNIIGEMCRIETGINNPTALNAGYLMFANERL